MSQIRVLPAEIANRIAAGEVIERPASVVKELVENAVDAQARHVQVRTSQGGTRLIQVTDDGVGMDRDDALLCLEAHATSKIRESEDVSRIATLGFRGEALPSIAAVSRFTLRTRRAGDSVGTEVLVEGGALNDVRDCGCAAGTQVRVEQLFSHMPARRKFLKGPNTEDGHIQESVLLQALAHPSVSFELYATGDREVLRTGSATELRARVGMLMGRDTLASLLPVDYEEAGVRVHGFAAKPGFTRSTRREQRVFINGRPASAQLIYYAIRDAYHTLVLKGRYPPVVLYLELAPERVDVNVHPAKREVRFREPRIVGGIVEAAVRRALQVGVGHGMPLSSGDASPAPGPAAAPFRLRPMPEQPGLPIGRAEPEAPPVPMPPPPVPDTSADAPEAPPASGDPAPAAPSPPAQAVSPARDSILALRLMGKLHDRYLVAEGEAGLVLVDQAAAHRRILFEHMLKQVSRERDMEQPLLIPVTIELAPADARLLSGALDAFQSLGFGIEPFGRDTFLVTGVPARFPGQDIKGMMHEILDDLRTDGVPRRKADHLRLAQIACRHAVRAGDVLKDEEVGTLLRELAAADMPYTCPDGRPVMISLSLGELAKRFGG